MKSIVFVILFYFIKRRHAGLLRLMKKGRILYNRFGFSVSSLYQLAALFFFYISTDNKKHVKKRILSAVRMCCATMRAVENLGKPKESARNISGSWSLLLIRTYSCSSVYRDVFVVRVFKRRYQNKDIIIVCQDMCLSFSANLPPFVVPQNTVLVEKIGALCSTSPLFFSILLLLVYMWGAV